jgi:tetratricopeptide (TPR) repeat protein
MLDWLRPLWLMFYSPARAMSEARSRAPLVPAMILAFLAQAGYLFFTEWLYRPGASGLRSMLLLLSVFRLSFGSVLFVALVFVPVIIFISNLFERRGSFSLVISQEYAALASIIFYAWAAAHLLCFPVASLASSSGTLAAYIESSLETTKQLQEFFKLTPEQLAAINNPHEHARTFFWLIMLPFFWLWSLLAVRVVFRLTWLRTIAAMISTSIVVYLALAVLSPLFTWVFASPFLLLILFVFLRGYFGEATRSHRARLAFKQNLEAATLNPADASAHYNLGLIHQQRNELDEARQRFERAIEIDPEELDAHYQLGRIARSQNRLSDAIQHFEPVVAQAPAHAQHEIWREIGATYLAAGQFEDALNALERFTDQRQSDPEGLYLMGRAHAGLGHAQEAAAAMRACIEAVKTAPAYKYRTEKRWLNEAQEFLRQG